jgi:hypothetical protein
METTNKQYKTLGNAIRESVFRAKEAPTMLPDETIEKLGLGEDDILVIKDIEELAEETKLAKLKKLYSKQRKAMEKTDREIKAIQKASKSKRTAKKTPATKREIAAVSRAYHPDYGRGRPYGDQG